MWPASRQIHQSEVDAWLTEHIVQSRLVDFSLDRCSINAPEVGAPPASWAAWPVLSRSPLYKPHSHIGVVV